MAPDRLPRRLGVVSAAGVLVGIVIGSGIFRVPSVVAAEVGSTGGAAMLWVLGAVVTLCGALTMAELATAFPRAGGPYVILREAWGPLPAFLFGWIKLVVTGPAGIAAVALIFAAYASAFVPLGEAGQRVLAAALVAGLSLVNIRSVPWSARVQNLSTLAKVLALVLMAALLFAFATP
ncbi:MAG TPA: amino acid permease, partial [Gemmatimonadales bacterium]|nr:amino acid permease [Gemmatimonadales bacterium]